MSGKQTHWMRVYAPGGVISPGDLRAVAATSRTLGDGTMRTGLRQEILVPYIKSKDVKRFCALVSPMKTAICGVDQAPNIASSFAAAEIGPATPWADSETFHHVIKSFDFQPGLRINLADPLQEVLPIYGSDINFVASKAENVWHVVLHVSYMQERRRLPIGVESEHIPAFVREVERLVLGEHEPAPETIVERLRHCGQKGMVALDEELPGAPAAYRSYAGQHAMPKEGGQWFGIGGAPGGRFSFDLVDTKGRMAKDNGVTMIGITPWNAWLVKGVKNADAPSWSEFFGKHAIPASPRCSDFWMGDAMEERDAMLLAEMSAGLAGLCPSVSGLSFGIGALRREEIAVRIERYTAPRLAFWRQDTFSIWHREGLDRRAAKLVALASGLPQAAVPERLAQIGAKFADAQASRSIVPTKTVKGQQSGGERVHQCPACLTRYDQQVGDPEQGIAAGTPFVEVPVTWQCPLCAAPKAAFVKLG